MINLCLVSLVMAASTPVVDDTCYLASVIGVASTKGAYALRLVECESEPRRCNYPSVNGVRPASVELELCEAGHGCSRRWLIYGKAVPDAGVPCTEHSKASLELKAAKTAISMAGIELKQAKAPITAPPNELVVSKEIAEQVGLREGDRLLWTWNALRDNEDFYGEWILTAHSGPTSAAIKRIPFVHGRGGGPLHRFLAPVLVSEFGIIIFHLYSPFGGDPNQTTEIVEIALKDVIKALKSVK